jgi:hypothetical protein
MASRRRREGRIAPGVLLITDQLKSTIAGDVSQITADAIDPVLERDDSCEAHSPGVRESRTKPESEYGAELKTRECLVCREAFPSAWAGERICRRCKSTSAWRSGALK